MHPAVLRVCAAFVILSFAANFQPTQTQSRNDDPTQDRVWLAVEEHPRGQLSIEPIATLDENELTPIQTSCLSDQQPPDDFAGKFLHSGKKYALLFGGASIGEGQVGEQNRSAATASLSYSGTVKIRGQVRTLATNGEPGDFRVASREPATAEQRGSALALAREIFSQHGIPEALLPKVRAEYVARTYLAPSPQPSLIGSFSLDTEDNEGLVHGLFFIASQPGEKLQPEFLWIHLAENETDEELLRFVDHADLLADGQDEVVGKLISVETQSHRYLIFRRTKDGAHWEQFFKTEPLGCSS
ncbi:MAG: hypothetical protein WBR10_08315 [Candidatus Acidiferrum sp.]